MQRCTGNAGTAELNRLKLGNRRDDASASRLERNRRDNDVALLRRVLECDAPSRELDGVAEFFTKGDAVELNDRAIRPIRQVVTLLTDFVDEAEYLAGRGPVVFDRVEPHLRECIQRPDVGVAEASKLEIENEDTKMRVLDRAEVMGSQDTCRSVAGIGKEFLALGGVFAIDPLELRHRHIDLTANDELRKRCLDAQRKAFDVLGVLSDVLADVAVAPGFRQRQLCVIGVLDMLICRAHRQPVDFLLDGVLLIRVLVGERRNLLRREHVLN